MTPKQRKLARHALRLPNPVKHNFCNDYSAICGGANYDEWVRMVDDGMAKTDGRKIKTGPEVEIVVFTLTHAGAMAALEPGESLYPEDFPE